MKMFKSKKRKAVTLVVGVAVVAGSAAGAFAAFSSTGTGSGTATVGTSTTWEVTTLAATGGPLTPGGPTQDIVYEVKNNSTGNQRLTNVRISVANPDGTEWTSVAGCSAADFSINGNPAGAFYDDTAQAADLDAGDSAQGSLTLQMVNTVANQDGCKGATVPLYLAAS